MTPKSSEQNLKSVRLAIRIQSILSSAHGDLIPSFASLHSASRILSFFFCAFSVFFCVFCAFCAFCIFCAFLCVSLCLLPLFISRSDLRLKPRGGGASERRSVGVFDGFSLFRSGVFHVPPRRDAAFTKIRPSHARATSAEAIFSPGRIQNRHSKAKTVLQYYYSLYATRRIFCC